MPDSFRFQPSVAQRKYPVDRMPCLRGPEIRSRIISMLVLILVSRYARFLRCSVWAASTAARGRLRRTTFFFNTRRVVSGSIGMRWPLRLHSVGWGLFVVCS